MSTINLVTAEGDIISIVVSIISKSKLIKDMLDDISADDNIPLPTIRKEILLKIIEFCEYINNNSFPEIEKPLRSTNILDLTTPFFADFINLEKEILFELICKSN